MSFRIPDFWSSGLGGQSALEPFTGPVWIGMVVRPGRPECPGNPDGSRLDWDGGPAWAARVPLKSLRVPSGLGWWSGRAAGPPPRDPKDFLGTFQEVLRVESVLGRCSGRTPFY